MSAAKIRLSLPEMELLNNKDWILTKNRVLNKTDELLGILHTRQQAYLEQYPGLIPEEVLAYGAKLSRGENYQGLPYRVLDHPRCFGTEGYFAIRSFCWWGNFFSVTLLLSGKYKAAGVQGLLHAYEQLRQQDLFYCVNEDPWQHHFEKDNYVSLQDITPEQLKAESERRTVLKLAKKIPLTEWDNAVEHMLLTFDLLLRSVHQLPSR